MISTGVVSQVSPLKVTLDGATTAVGAKAIYSPALSDRVVVLQYGRLLLALPTAAISGGGGGGGGGLTSFQGRSTAAAVLELADVTGTGLAASDVGAAAKASNLSDLASAASARTNLGLDSAATQPSSAFDAAGAAAALLPSLTGNAGKVLAVNAGGSAVVWGTLAASPSLVYVHDAGLLAASSSYVLTLGRPIPVGETLLAAVKTGGGAAVTGMSDSKGNTWTIDVHSSGAAANMAVVRCSVTTALAVGDTITATCSASGVGQLTVFEFAGLPSTLTLDGTASAVTATTSVTVTGPATTHADFVFSAAATGTSDATLACSTGTALGPSGTNYQRAVALFSVASGATQAFAWTGALGNAAAVYVAYKLP